MRSVKLARVLVAGAVLFGGAVACSDDSTDAESGSERLDSVNVDLPEDRADEAVDAALGRIDPCALIDPAGAGIKRSSTASLVRELSPHSCGFGDDAGLVDVVIGADFSNEDRFNASLESLGGAKAYVVPSEGMNSCTVALPVSFSQAIVLRTTRSAATPDACDDAKAFARTAAKRLKRPASVAYPNGPITLTACELMRRAVDRSDGEKLRRWADELTLGVDGCGVMEDGPDVSRPLLSIKYTGPSFSDEYRRAGKVRGRRLAARTLNGCTMAWNEPTMRKSADGHVAQLELVGSSCEETKRLVRDITKAIDQYQPSKSATAQRPVLYQAGKPDAPALGACIDLVDFTESECRPYVETDAPSDGEETIEAAGEDPNVNCAIATDAIEEHYGASLRPVTAIGRLGMHEGDVRRCGFVDESHAIEVWIGVSNEPMQVPDESEIGGHPARDETSTISSDYLTRDLAVALDDEDAPGLLYGKVVLRPGRGREYIGDEGQLDDLDEVMTDIVDAHFNT